jgi:hypothetical protein
MGSTHRVSRYQHVCFRFIKKCHLSPATNPVKTNLFCTSFLYSDGWLILDLAGSRYARIALYHPVINRIGGDLVSVQDSRISTQVHGECEIKILPGGGRICDCIPTISYL